MTDQNHNVSEDDLRALLAAEITRRKELEHQLAAEITRRKELERRLTPVENATWDMADWSLLAEAQRRIDSRGEGK